MPIGEVTATVVAPLKDDEFNRLGDAAPELVGSLWREEAVLGTEDNLKWAAY
jgi:hypothetical protein